jgi:hypothetical protein
MPTGVKADRETGGVRISWKAALDSNGNAVAGYHVYRATSAAGPYSKISTELITATEFIDTSGVGAASGSGSGSYYAVSSEDADGDESVRSLGIRPAAIVSSAGAAVPACFIQKMLMGMKVCARWASGRLRSSHQRARRCRRVLSERWRKHCRIKHCGSWPS